MLALMVMLSLGFHCADVFMTQLIQTKCLFHSCQVIFVCLFSFLVLFQLRESFKDIKKKFNNMKFNYMKKNEKLRNMKAVKNQIQQIDIYLEKLQVRTISRLCMLIE